MEPLIRKTVIGLDKFKDWVLAQIFFAIIAILKLFPAKGAIWFCAEAARGLGKYYPRNKMARENLKLAFPSPKPQNPYSLSVCIPEKQKNCNKDISQRS